MEVAPFDCNIETITRTIFFKLAYIVSLLILILLTCLGAEYAPQVVYASEDYGFWNGSNFMKQLGHNFDAE